jgi:CelD/BcsL family acetyltransferase involved in cellulose biosynthesis
MLRVETVTSLAELEALEPEWRVLEAASRNRLPFQTFIWSSSWWHNLHQERAALRDRLALRSIREPGGRLVGVAPLMVTERPGTGPLRARCLQFIGPDPNVTEVRGPLFQPDYELEGYLALIDDVLASARSVDWIHWSGLSKAGCAAIEQRQPWATWGAGQVCSLIELPETWDDLKGSRSRNLKEALRKGYNSLKREGLPYSLEVVTGVEIASALEDFFRLHQARAELEGTVHHRDVFATEASRAFLRETCERFAHDGALRIFRLRIRDAVAATRVGFLLGDSLYLYYSGYDPAYARYSVMTTALAETFKWAIEAHLTTVNLSTGRDLSKQRWQPREVEFGEATWVAPSAFGRAKYQVVEAVRGSAGESYVHRLLARQAP